MKGGGGEEVRCAKGDRGSSDCVVGERERERGWTVVV